MKVKLINYSKFHELDGDIETQIAHCARVSNPDNQINMLNSQKLIQYLIKNNHWSPFEMVNICLEISTTRDIARQILRHRSFSFQEFSQRYANPTILGIEYKEARLQDFKNRQNSIEHDNEYLENQWRMQQQVVSNHAINAYQWALDNGIAKEQARAVMPEGITMSKLYMNGTMRSWIHYIQLRSANGTQKEHREIAIECANIIEPIFPMIKEFIEQ
jgi:thymidylate synthase (FAD)